MREAIVEFWPDAETRPCPGDLEDLQRVQQVVDAYNRKIAALRRRPMATLRHDQTAAG